MSDNPIQIFIAMFGDELQAKQSLTDFQAMDREGSIELIDAAVIVRGADGKVRFEETADPSGKKWAKRGAIAGGVVGLIFPPSLIASAVVGGGAGGIWGKIRDKGFKDEDLKAVGESMDPGTSAIIAIAEDRMIERLEKGLEGTTGSRAMPSAPRRRWRSPQREARGRPPVPDSTPAQRFVGFTRRAEPQTWTSRRMDASGLWRYPRQKQLLGISFVASDDL